VSIGLRQSRFLGLNSGGELWEATVKLIISAAVLCLFAGTAVSGRQGQEKEKEDKPAQQEEHKKQDGPETHKQRQQEQQQPEKQQGERPHPQYQSQEQQDKQRPDRDRARQDKPHQHTEHTQRDVDRRGGRRILKTASAPILCANTGSTLPMKNTTCAIQGIPAFAF
jgi:hypothetical protein